MIMKACSHPLKLCLSQLWKKTNQLNLIYKDFCLCVELPIKANKNKMSIISTPANERKRFGGKKKVNAFKDGFKILISMIVLKFN